VPESNEMLAKIMAYGMEGKGANGVGKLKCSGINF